MQMPISINFRDMEPSDAIEAYVSTRAGKLERFADQIMRCKVMVEAPHRHHAKGKRYHVRIDMIVSGDELVVNKNGEDPAHEDVYACIDHAFDDAQRVLQDYNQRRRGEVKRH